MSNKDLIERLEEAGNRDHDCPWDGELMKEAAAALEQMEEQDDWSICPDCGCCRYIPPGESE